MRDFYIRQEQYEREMHERVEPYLATHRQDFSVTAADGVRVCAAAYSATDPKGTVMMAHGFTESAVKYREMIYYFLRGGYSVVICDFRGHGKTAPRLDDPRLTHIEDFSLYVRDFLLLADRVRAEMSEPYFLFSHSMGGAVSALVMEERPDFFCRAALSSPMIAPARFGLPYGLAAAAVGIPCLLGLGKKTPSRLPSSGVFDDGGFAAACGTSEPRYAYYARYRLTDPRYQTIVPTFAWVREAFRVTKKILRRGAPESILTPVLLFSGDREDVVLTPEQEKFVSRLPHGERIVVAGAKHEVYMSRDEELFPYVEKILAFFDEGIASS